MNSADQLTDAALNGNRIIFGAICELILVATAAGTAIMLFPALKQVHTSLAVGYLSFRLLEVIFIMIGILSVLTALSVSRAFAAHTLSDAAVAAPLMTTLINAHKWTFMLGPNFMLAINTAIYSFAFYRSRMIPVLLSVLGLSASALIMTAALLELFGIIEQLSAPGVLLALPIALYEMTLAVWLIINGLRAPLS